MIDLPAPAGTSADSADLKLRLPKSIESVELGRLAALAHLAPFDLSPVTINRIEVILEELISNVVRHSAQAQSILLEAGGRDGVIAISVEDDGAPFNPLEQAAPAPFSTLENATLGGLGIPLIKKLSQSVHYQRISECNRLSVTIAAE